MRRWVSLCVLSEQYCLNFVSAAQELMACLYCVTNMLRINIPYTGYNTQENTALSAGRQTSICETRLGFQERAVAQSGHLLNVHCMLFCWLHPPSLTVVTMESKCFLSPGCLLINLDKGSALVFTHTLSILMLLHSCLCWPSALLFHTEGDYRCLQELSLYHRRLPLPLKGPQILWHLTEKGIKWERSRLIMKRPPVIFVITGTLCLSEYNAV